jgi:DNA integrity scanning protein DisA with diadenylate cyclase activity
MMDSIGEGKSLELLKDHLYSKQDIQLRQKLTNFKEKALSKQQKYMDLIGSRRVAPYVLKLVAKRGYLKNIHRIILYQLDHVKHKYQRLTGAHSRDYIRMKHEVAENSCPSAIE